MAIKDYSISIGLNKNYLNAYLNRGVAKQRQKKFDEAINDYTIVIKQDRNNTFGYFNRGIVFYITNKNKEAIIDFNMAIELDDKNEYYYYRGLALNSSGDQKKACSDWQIALAKGYQEAEGMIKKYCNETYAEIIGTADSYYNLAEIKLQEFKYSEALNYYSKVLEMDSTYTKAYKKKAITYGKLYKYEDAISNYTIALKYNNLDKELYFMRGRSKFELGKNTEAIEDYNLAINIDPKYDLALFNRGLVKNKLNKKEEACSDWLMAHELGFKKASELIKENCE